MMRLFRTNENSLTFINVSDYVKLISKIFGMLNYFYCGYQSTIVPNYALNSSLK